MRQPNKGWIRLLAVLAVLALLTAVLFVVLECGHDCVGEDCRICQILDLCATLLRGLWLLGIPGLFFAVPAVLRRDPRRLLRPRQLFTLVQLKVKLSN